ncbi:unnamed protein product, partial [Gulo gulo]
WCRAEEWVGCDNQLLPLCPQTAPTPEGPPLVGFSVLQPFEPPAPEGGRARLCQKKTMDSGHQRQLGGRPGLAVCREGSVRCHHTWVGLGVLVPGRWPPKVTESWLRGCHCGISWLLPPFIYLSSLLCLCGSFVPGPSRSPCCRKGVRLAGHSQNF